MKFTPTQRKRVGELLAKPHESLENLTGELEELISSFEVERDRWATVVWHPTHKVLQVIGLYATFNQAAKDTGKRIVQTGGTQVRIAKVLDPSTIDIGAGGTEQLTI